MSSSGRAGRWTFANSLRTYGTKHGFEGGPYLGFPQSREVYGDGSIVVVPAPGHTPGSIIIFVTERATRLLATSYMEGITLREERSWLVRKMGADEDAAANRENPLHVIALKERLSDLIIVPAHEMRAFARMPGLSPPSSGTGASP